MVFKIRDSTFLQVEIPHNHTGGSALKQPQVIELLIFRSLVQWLLRLFVIKSPLDPRGRASWHLRIFPGSETLGYVTTKAVQVRKKISLSQASQMPEGLRKQADSTSSTFLPLKTIIFGISEGRASATALLSNSPYILTSWILGVRCVCTLLWKICVVSVCLQHPPVFHGMCGWKRGCQEDIS